MAASATPIPVRCHGTTLFELPLKKRKQRRLLEQEQRRRALLEAEEASRSEAWCYIVEFLQQSEWCDQMDQIAVASDAVPTMHDLVSYGFLDEKEGTIACRRLFKAPVVWDELGHGLWKVLRSVADQKRAALDEVARANAWNAVAEASSSATSSRRSSSRRVSEDSCATTMSGESVSGHAWLSSSPARKGSVPRIFARITARR
ncbi:uncharacterized protein MAM_06270 [Metarhizium album ARSEF 1941]|uniref:Uncharacterized protein n=1 Tax=Metarhizium album (strain ARSEF 1941) TaxID=1081103 RepID=A0A0B2WPG6_METAS|nr:uncharacterized protein MAM_06270 [Metarhizium album ARSEF 1941]KHN95908.1 hypothetical protein MAM_06270 [Metarhizium album ARSEF 1941]